MTTSFAGTIREILKRLAPQGDIAYADIALELDMITKREKQRLYLAMRDFIKRGECVKVAEGVVRYARPIDPHPADKTRCMFRLIRANRYNTITIADLVANCGVSEHTASEYLNVLTRHGITRRIGADNRTPRFQMIKDPGPNLIKNEENAKKLRRLRQAKKQTLAQLELAEQSLKSATDALAQARREVATIEEEGETS